jgi:DNA-binding beta-propeller fold protein YncE
MLMRRVLAVGLAAGLMSLTGCAGFFVCQKASCPATGSASSTVTNYAYASNSATGSTYINGYNLSGGTLATATTGSPYSLGYTPIAMAVNPADTFLYVAVDSALTSGTSGMYVYSIGTGGALSIANSGLAVGAGNYTAIDISPDGQWLFALDTTGLILY